MRKYVSPFAEVVVFDAMDVVLASVEEGRPGDVENDDYDASAASTGNTPV